MPLTYRFNTVQNQTGSYLAPGSGYSVTVLKPGGVASATSTGATITLHAGHGFAAGDKIIIGGDSSTFSGSQVVSSTTATSIVMDGGTYNVASGDVILNLGADTGTSTPNWDAGRTIYSDPTGNSAVSNSTLTTNSDGEYNYYHGREGWEVIRSGSTILDVIRDVKQQVTTEGLSYFNVKDFGAKGDGSTNDLTAIQAAITAATAVLSDPTDTNNKIGAVVYFPVGEYLVNGTIVLPKALNATHPRTVCLEGATKHSSVIVGGSGFSSGDAVIEWEATAYRVFDQRIEKLTIIAPRIDGTHCIRYTPTDKSTWSAANAQSFTLLLYDVELEGWNQYTPSLVRIEGISRSSRFINVGCDPNLSNRVYDTIAFHFDDTPLLGSGEFNWADDLGCNWGRFETVWTTPQRGGHCALFKGRALHTSFDNCCGGFGCYSDPVIDLYNTISCLFRNISTEGMGEDPQIRLTDCRFVRFENLALGHPEQPDGKSSPWAGNGIDMIACTDCYIERIGDDYGMSSWSGVDTGTFKLLTLDSDCKRNRIILSDNLDSPYDLTDEVTDNGTDNWISLLSQTDDRYWYRGGPIASSVSLRGDHKEQLDIKQISETITVNTGGTTTDSTADLLPATSIIEAVVWRVAASLTGVSSFTLGDATTAARFGSSSGVGTGAGNASVAMDHWKGGVATDAAGPTQATAAKLRVTCNTTPSAGSIYVTVYYRQFTAPSVAS